MKFLWPTFDKLEIRDHNDISQRVLEKKLFVHREVIGRLPISYIGIHNLLTNPFQMLLSIFSLFHFSVFSPFWFGTFFS
jgi:hypothetical protein